MTPERLERIAELFQVAKEHPPEEWALLLERECADDAELRKEVESLLAALPSADGFLETPIGGSAA